MQPNSMTTVEKAPGESRHFTLRGRTGAVMDLLLARPEDGEGKIPLVIILHGLTGFKEEAHLAALARKLRLSHFAALRADLYGHGAGGGLFRDHTLQKWVAEIRQLIDEARTCGQYSQIFLCGHSQGALCALLAAGEEPEHVSGVIALAPALRIPAKARSGTLFDLSFDPAHIPEELTVWGRPLSAEYVRLAQTVREEAITAYPGPVLLIHSDTDERVPLSVSEEAAARFPQARLIVTHGDTHDFDRHPDEMAEAAVNWLQQAAI